jgi:beta-ketoacyl synthase-like protein
MERDVASVGGRLEGHAVVLAGGPAGLERVYRIQGAGEGWPTGSRSIIPGGMSISSRQAAPRWARARRCWSTAGPTERKSLSEGFCRVNVAGSGRHSGKGCRFPGSVASPDGLWELMVFQRDAIGKVPADRWEADELMSFQHPDEAAKYNRGYFLDGDIWAWEAGAFSAAQKEGVFADPQHRLAAEVAWEAVEHAGIPIALVGRG